VALHDQLFAEANESFSSRDEGERVAGACSWWLPDSSNCAVICPGNRYGSPCHEIKPRDNTHGLRDSDLLFTRMGRPQARGSRGPRIHVLAMNTNVRLLTETLCWWARDPFCHVGIVGHLDGEPFILEMGPKGFNSRPVESLPARYERIGVGRFPLCDPCQSTLPAAAMTLGQSNPRYSVGQAAVVGAGSLMCRLPWSAVSAASYGSLNAAARWPGWAETRGRLMCSSFIARVLTQACDSCRPETTCLQGRLHQRTRPGVARAADQLLITPSDIWRSAGLHRWDLPTTKDTFR